MAAGAVLNAMWDLWAKSLDKPLWKLLVDAFIFVGDQTVKTSAVVNDNQFTAMVNSEPSDLQR